MSDTPAIDHARLVVADDEPNVRQTYAELLAVAGHRVDAVADGIQLIQRIREQPCDMLFLDMNFPPSDGVTLLQEVKKIQPSTLVVGFTGHATVSVVLQAFRSGAFEFLEKPVPRERLLQLAQRAVEVREMGDKRRRLAEQLENERLNVVRLRERLKQEDPFQHLVGGSRIYQDLLNTMREVARTDSTVLLTGESGTGKGRIARSIHEASSRGEAPFVEANCVVYSEGVLHSELFGHERGAFTGAARTKRGRFELARGGTLFLDEIGEIAPATQLLLLRVLQERTFERVGGEETLDADVRLIAATNRDLEAAIRQGEFRQDLYYRLNVIPVRLPALREHPEDVPLLVRHFIDRHDEESGRHLEIGEAAMQALMRYPWPGNIRELENLVERLIVLRREGPVTLQDLPSALRGESGSAVAMPGTLQDLERQRIVEALREAGGNKKRAARLLGIHRSTLYGKLRRYRIEDPGADASAAKEARAQPALA